MHFGPGCDKKVATELLTPLHPRLLALEGPLKDSTIALPEGEITLGRDPTNAVPLNDPSVSRKHCLFRREEERFQVRDLESRNGTVVNGTAVKEQWLRHGDEIVVDAAIGVLTGTCLSSVTSICFPGTKPAGGGLLVR